MLKAAQYLDELYISTFKLNTRVNVLQFNEQTDILSSKSPKKQN